MIEADVSSLVFQRYYAFALPTAFPELADRTKNMHAAFIGACDALITATMPLVESMNDTVMNSAFLSFLKSTRLIADVVHPVFTSTPASHWHHEWLMCSQKISLYPDVLIFLLAVAQRQNIARLADATEWETVLWSSTMSIALFDKVARLLTKVTCGKASSRERATLNQILVAVLLVTDHSSLFIFRDAMATPEAVRLAERWTTSNVHSVTDWVFYVDNLVERR